MLERNYYSDLGADANATRDELKKAYRKIARADHPDVNPDPKAQERMKAAAEAYDVLSDPKKRREYDLGRGAYGSSYANSGKEANSQDRIQKTGRMNMRDKHMAVGGLVGTVLFSNAGLVVMENAPVMGETALGLGIVSAGVTMRAFSRGRRRRSG